MSTPIVLSGIQPTGSIHLGNYLGFIRNGVSLQNSYKCFFFLADLHTLTSQAYNSDDLKNNSISTLATYLACGIDPENSVLFSQSAVPAHAELMWIFSCITSTGQLNRMTQFKEKSRNKVSTASLGLYSYPVLMAADILLYKANIIPVGIDQKQHLELARDIAQAFNTKYNIEYFKLPEPLIMQESAKIMSLRDGKKKMSKSDLSDYSRINLEDSNDSIAQKINKATTDSIVGFDITNLDNRPEIKNLVNIYATLSNISIEQICVNIANLSTKQFKEELAELIITNISPIRQKLKELLEDTTHLHSILTAGNNKAASIANKHIIEIKKIVGYW
ncbi:tryptophan--tRNA ligase [Ehrlichia ruminantium]|uniref:Tryptophan--tRNA ligase n=1 Tax=Ehrlichia ruminantium TaxID=779 RepID=A0AAE6Q9R7_EHRRU|nr:tryptophan--tRNA ligase [Ehrlichia ruminantium]QGR02198.1 tryptophan--tRNA ligase [Ehrlichia ruminantium]QGR03120.1 tryptophan--tRNA ligase [Ehrlichia ruminantium]QGR04045.1 tryptophan--tRNA ligase [Ehrlichia ruminantium]